MKRVNTILTIVLFMTGCVGCGKSVTGNDSFFTVNVTKKYPKKELILQDFMDVEYIALETNNEFLNQGILLDIGENFIIVRNSIRDGDIFIYDRNGKALRKINRKGQSGEEYTQNIRVLLDEENNELFVNDISKILVYDLYGKFKRSFNHKEDVMYVKICNYDKDNLICNGTKRLKDENFKEVFVIISKQDGSIVKYIEIPTENVKSSILMVTINDMSFGMSLGHTPLIPHRGNWIFMEPSSDTVFRYFPDHSMVPFIVRTPSIHSMPSPEIFLFPSILTDRYHFMVSVKKEYDYEMRRIVPSTYLIYDIEDKEIYEYTLLNDDYTNKVYVDMTERATATLNDEIAFCYKLEAHTLLENYEKGQLKGKLKEVAAKLNEDSNPVIMIAKYKK